MLPQKRILPPWLLAAVAIFAVAWGGNQFTPLLVMYKDLDGLSTGAVDVLLGAYVLGIVPALLIGGPLSDRFGRRPLMLPAPALALIASIFLILGAGNPAILFVGRVLSGIGLGLGMVVGGSWVKELSVAPYDTRADDAAGARRASMSLTAGFGLGAAVAAGLAQFAPFQATLPYLVHIVVALLGFLAAAVTPETHARQVAPSRLVDDLRIPAAKHRRFLWVVVPMAPWVFGCAASAYAILPGLMSSRTEGFGIGFSGFLCLVGLGCGLVLQQVGKRIDNADSARGVVVSLGVAVPAMACAAWAAYTVNPWIATLAAALLGSAYGLLLVSGLQEVQRIAGPHDLAGLTAVYYSLTYLGFFIPAALAVLHSWLTYPWMFIGGCVVATLCLSVVVSFYRKHLPHQTQESGLVEA
ncbi:MFS transporter [uncultured Kocuria sp.]|uniref:MFS transporter n=1 Tax=uncultured Kocuria sp. TaxID=259305 RepID=UPI0025948155|nr:MFS transporter [uncultured Kocuria sp.]MCT1367078.1 MFS transporter [Rothia sp. p3-SID1597]